MSGWKLFWEEGDVRVEVVLGGRGDVRVEVDLGGRDMFWWELFEVSVVLGGRELFEWEFSGWELSCGNNPGGKFFGWELSNYQSQHANTII